MTPTRLTYKPMLVVFTGVMAVLAIALNAITWSRVTMSIDAVIAAKKDQELWESLLITITDAETGQRGYIITGDVSYLEPFDRANLRVGQDLTALKENAIGRPAELAEVEAIEVSVVTRLDQIKMVRVVREREGLEAARAMMLKGEGKRLMDQLHEAILGQVERRKRESLARASEMARDLRWGYAAALGAGIVALGSGLVAFLLLRDALRHAKREQRFAEEKRRAESADREKSAFLATMSHEIRTPMNAILGFAELLRDRLTHEQELRYVDAILAGGRSLLQLINDILDLSKVEAGMLQVQAEPTDLRSTAYFVQQLFQQLAAQRGIDLRIQVDDTIPRSLLIDQLRLRQVLINLVGNALKFTEAGHVALRFEGDPRQSDLSRLRLRIAVEDTGRGIAPEQLETIFQPFVQVTEGEKAGIPGTGLGLAIVNRLVRLMGGTITVASEPGRGTTFELVFAEVEVSSRLAESLGGAEDEVIDFDVFRASTILIADDNPTNRELLSGIFEGSHHRVVLAADGEEAVAAAMREEPDLVLMDVRMPKKDGFEALAEIRSEARFRLLPVVAVTASSLGSEDDRARRKFDGYLRKPFSRAQLFQQFAQFIPHAAKEDSVGWNLPELLKIESPECAEAWRHLAGILDEIEKEDLPDLAKSMSVSEIAGFALRLRELSRETSCEPLARYAAALESDATSFSPGLMEQTLGRFPALVEAIRAAAEGSGTPQS
ncbi:MAG: CHASE3 domain-containing protein [Verrucomicrobiales bacterium]|nr:CHASE3 domain-containing protein [Verrucomicrobiales bacterium]